MAYPWNEIRYPSTRNQKAEGYIAYHKNNKDSLRVELEMATLKYLEEGGVVNRITKQPEVQLDEERLFVDMLSAKQKNDKQSDNEIVERYRGLTDL